MLYLLFSLLLIRPNMFGGGAGMDQRTISSPDPDLCRESEIEFYS